MVGAGGFGGDGGVATSAKLNYPGGIVFDTCGNLIVNDAYNYRIRKIFMNTTGSISALPGDTVCVGTPVTYTATASGGTVTAYKWYKNGMISGTGSTFSYTPADGDSLRCLCTISSCGYGTVDMSSNTINMVIASPITPTISLSGLPSAAIGSMVTVNATVSGAGSTYNVKWFKNGTLFSSTTVPVVIYTKAVGTDTITARVISTSDGCYDSVTSATHIVTADGAGVSTLSAGGQLVVCPNPAKGELHILTYSSGAYSISGIDGRGVSTGTLSCGDNVVSLGTLSPGIYVIEVQDNGGGRVMKRLVKE